MDRNEAIKFLAIVKVAYPTAYRDMDNANKQATVNMWHISFPKTPFTVMSMAFDNFRRKSVFPPTVAEINEELKNVHYKALEDMQMARMYENDDYKNNELWKKAKYIADVTFEFKHIDTRINYGNINCKMIDSYYDEQKL